VPGAGRIYQAFTGQGDGDFFLQELNEYFKTTKQQIN